MLHAITAGTILVSSLAAPAGPPPAGPPPLTEMVIDVAAANGSGCAKNTAEVTVSPDNKAFTVTYSEFTAQVGPQAKPTDFRKNCQLALDVRVPSGFTYAIMGADYRGFAHLEEGATGTETAFYYFQGNQRTTTSKHDFRGWMEGPWQITDRVEVDSLSYLPCGDKRYLNVNTELRVNAGTSKKGTTSFLTMDSSDGNLQTIYHVAWQKC